jgi:hypothetical protein
MKGVKNMHKRIIVMLMVMLMLVCSLTACKNKKNEEPTTNDSETTQTEDIIINDSDINIDTENHEEYGEMQFIFGATSSKEKIINGKPEKGDMVIIGGYQYTYNVVLEDLHTTAPMESNGWSVYSIDKSRKVAEGIKAELFGIPVKSMNYCYKGCEQLETVKEIPETIESAKGAFESCAKLQSSCNLPKGLIDARNMFAYCTNLEKAPALPETLKTIDRMFYYCRTLSGDINIPQNIETFSEVFSKTQKEIFVIGNGQIIETIVNEFWNVSKK